MKTLKYLLIFFLLSCATFISQAQDISVKEFYLAENDLTANNAGTLMYDQDGHICALIRIQTTQKGFHFDVGTLGVRHVDENHIGEIWVYVPYGVRHISIRHPQLGTLSNYNFPCRIDKAKTYIMSITSDKVFVNIYDDTHKKTLNIEVIPYNAELTINGVQIPLDKNGKAKHTLSYGTYTYKVAAEGFYSKEGQVTIGDKANTLIIKDLKPITGTLNVTHNVKEAEIYIDGVLKAKGISPLSIPLQIGQHEVKIVSAGYRVETRNIILKEEQLTVIFSLEREANFQIITTPSDARISIDGLYVGISPCSKKLVTGNYRIKATLRGYKDYNEFLELDSSNPVVNIQLQKILNYKNEFYFEVLTWSNCIDNIGIGASMGGFIHNVNIEASYLYGFAKSEDIYWNGGDSYILPITYHNKYALSFKAGYGFPIGSRFRLTPQFGIYFLKLTGGSKYAIADGAYSNSLVGSIRTSVAITNFFAISLTPEYQYSVIRSDGYKALATGSDKIDKWGNGFNLRLGLVFYTN